MNAKDLRSDMNAKDTVINNKDIVGLYIPCGTCWYPRNFQTSECLECMALKHRERQAEVTWDMALGSIVDKENFNYKRGFRTALEMMQAKLKECESR